MMKGRFFIPVLIVLFACTDGKVDTSQIQAEMKAREVMVVPEAKIVERTFHVGDSLLKTIKLPEVNAEIKDTYKTWKLIGDIEVVCNLYKVSETYTLTGKEKQVFEAYQYSAENQQSADPNVQKLENEMMLYSAPLEENGVITGMWSVKLPRKYLILSLPE